MPSLYDVLARMLIINKCYSIDWSDGFRMGPAALTPETWCPHSRSWPSPAWSRCFKSPRLSARGGSMTVAQHAVRRGLDARLHWRRIGTTPRFASRSQSRHSEVREYSLGPWTDHRSSSRPPKLPPVCRSPVPSDQAAARPETSHAPIPGRPWQGALKGCGNRLLPDRDLVEPL